MTVGVGILTRLCLLHTYFHDVFYMNNLEKYMSNHYHLFHLALYIIIIYNDIILELCMLLDF